MNSKSFPPLSRPLVDHVGLWRSKHHKPVEFLLDLKLDFQDCNKLRVMRVSFMFFFKKKAISRIKNSCAFSSILKRPILCKAGGGEKAILCLTPARRDK